MSSVHIRLHNPLTPPLNLRRPFRRSSFAIACLNVEVEAENSNALRLDSSKLGLAKEVMEAEAKVLVGTYARAPVVLASGKGCKLYDVEGREYLDLSAGIAVNSLGHGDEDWLKAVVEQASTLTHVSNMYYSIPQVRTFHAFFFFLCKCLILFGCWESVGKLKRKGAKSLYTWLFNN